MTGAERAFFKLISELASECLFAQRDGVAERILDAFEAAIAAVRPSEPPPDPDKGYDGGKRPKNTGDAVRTEGKA